MYHEGSVTSTMYPAAAGHAPASSNNASVHRLLTSTGHALRLWEWQEAVAKTEEETALKFPFELDDLRKLIADPNGIFEDWGSGIDLDGILVHPDVEIDPKGVSESTDVGDDKPRRIGPSQKLVSIQVCGPHPVTGQRVCYAKNELGIEFERIGFCNQGEPQEILALALRPKGRSDKKPPSLFVKVGDEGKSIRVNADFKRDGPYSVNQLLCKRYGATRNQLGRPLLVVAAKEGGKGAAYFCSLEDDQAESLPLRLPHEEAVLFVDLSRDKSLLVTACQDDFARVVSVNRLLDLLEDDKRLQEEEKWAWCEFQHTSDVVHANFAPVSANGEHRLVTVSSEGEAAIWRFEVGDQPKRFESPETTLSHGAKIKHAEFSSDGSLVVTASQDRTARIWETSSGNLVGILRHDSPVTRAWFNAGDGSIETVCQSPGKELERVHHFWDLNVDNEAYSEILEAFAEGKGGDGTPTRLEILSSRRILDEKSRLETLKRDDLMAKPDRTSG
jgi:WD40 repeat protein